MCALISENIVRFLLIAFFRMLVLSDYDDNVFDPNNCSGNTKFILFNENFMFFVQPRQMYLDHNCSMLIRTCTTTWLIISHGLKDYMNMSNIILTKILHTVQLLIWWTNEEMTSRHCNLFVNVYKLCFSRYYSIERITLVSTKSPGWPE